jgi:hypothetical protein
MGFGILSGLVFFNALLTLYLILKINTDKTSLRAMALRLAAVDITATRIETIADLDAQIAARKKKLESPSISLQEFIADMAETGCGMVRIDPDAVMIRGIRS